MITRTKTKNAQTRKYYINVDKKKKSINNEIIKIHITNLRKAERWERREAVHVV